MSWKDRNAAVVPWISKNNADDAGPTSNNASHHQHGRKIPLCNKILSLLSTRERIGQNRRVAAVLGQSNEGRVVTDDGLALAGAWNSRRLQNMTLAIGPGTPASCCVLDDDGPSSSSDDDGDDHDEMLYRVDSEDSNEAEADNVLQEDDSIDDGEGDDSEHNEHDGEDDSEQNENDMDLLSDAEEGETFHFDDGGRLVKDGDDDEQDKGKDDQVLPLPTHRTSGTAGRRRSRRSRWEKEEQSHDDDSDDERMDSDNDENIHDNDDDDDYSSHHTNIENINNEDNDSSHNNSDDSSHSTSHDSAGLTAHDRYNIQQVEQYIDHLESVHGRRRREQRRANNNSHRQASRASSVLGQQYEQREVARSMKHGGCINTVSWLDCGWRISTVSSHDDHASASSSYSSNNYNPTASPRPTPSRKHYDKEGGFFATPLEPFEYPTQLLTSGDDHLVKFWDVSQSMGSASPLPGGSATVTPFSSTQMPVMACSTLVDSWKNHGGGGYSTSSHVGTSSSSRNNHRRYLPGIVHPLVTLTTGHVGNVFHVTPVPHSLGKIATCAADGYLRLLDVEVQSSSSGGPTNGQRNRSNSTASSSSNTGDSSAIVISPEYQSENGESESAFFFRNSLMCFSHHFLSANVGLVCSERGLLHFDIRLPARSQKRGSLVPELKGTCKACFPWRLGSSKEDDANSSSELESAYVFAGGSGVDVGLYDLRMTGSSSSSSNDNQVVQKYRPQAFMHHNKSSAVAVSGIDLSKDKRELLVSYESDHVYTFPIFEGRDRPTLEDLDGSSGVSAGNYQENKSGLDKDKPVPELAVYGGHLNRLTFLKSAKYAGPNDEYICTGSDSGHAWIYEKKSGAVVSFMKADNSTCNGIQPHPLLPYFITYGIDSTAKLWRATTPVDIEVDDSDLGRYNYNSKNVKYEKSIVVDQWKKARKGKEVDLDDDENLSFFPDETSEDDNDDPDHLLGVFIRSRYSHSESFIGNDLSNLNTVLAKNYFTCARAMGMGGGGADDDQPVKSGIAAMKTRVSLIKLRNQADRLGLEFDSMSPWIFKHKEHLKKMIIEEQQQECGSSGGDSGDKIKMVSYGSLADLIPDNPSDWLPFDQLLANPPHSGGMRFNERYERYHLESSADRSITPVCRVATCPNNELGVDGNFDVKIIDKLDEEASKQPFSLQSNIKIAEEQHNYDPIQAWDVLFQTVSLLKEAGNEALKASLPILAARRYDKAVNYCSIAYLEFPVGTVDFLAEHQYVISKNGGYECRWNELLKTLIMVRLNLAMVFLKKEIDDAKGSVTQANLSLKELKPFATERGVVLTGKKLSKKRTDEPHGTYTEAKGLQAKAYFRLGSAQLVMNEYDDAVKTFEHCVESTKEAGMTVELTGVLRKMTEAKGAVARNKRRNRKKFKFMFSTPRNDDDDDSKGNEEVDG